MSHEKLVSVVISYTAAVGIALTELWMALVPGPNMMYLVSRSIGQGRTAGLYSLLGTAVGFVVYLVVVNMGLAIVFVAVPWLFISLKAAGVVYLMYLAWQTLKPGGHGLLEVSETKRASPVSLFRMGLLTNLLNPKVAILYVAIIPQFIEPARGHVTAQGFALGGIQIAIGIAVNGLIVMGAASAARLVSQRPSWLVWQRRIAGSLLAAVAVGLAREVPAKA